MSLRLFDVSKEYSGNRVVSGVSFEVHPEEALAIVGPSGCGKTTLLRLAAGLERCDSGSVSIDGTDVTTLPPSARGVYMVFQKPQLYPSLRVDRNLAFPHRSITKEQKSLFCEAVANLRLEEFLKRRASGLSGGETQRVALGKALLARKKLCLLDESLSEVDPLHARTLREYLRAELTSDGRSLVFVTHDQREAAVVGDRVAVMKNGHIHQVDRTDVLFHQPATRFVAEFLDHGGLVVESVELRSANGEYSLESDWFGCVPVPGRPQVLAGGVVGELALAARLSAACLVERGAGQEGVTSAEVERIIPFFGAHVAQLRFDPTRVVRVPLQVDDSELRVGGSVGVDLLKAEFHVFAADENRSRLFSFSVRDRRTW